MIITPFRFPSFILSKDEYKLGDYRMWDYGVFMDGNNRELPCVVIDDVDLD
jgi:hypothetical protein